MRLLNFPFVFHRQLLNISIEVPLLVVLILPRLLQRLDRLPTYVVVLPFFEAFLGWWVGCFQVHAQTIFLLHAQTLVRGGYGRDLLFQRREHILQLFQLLFNLSAFDI